MKSHPAATEAAQDPGARRLGLGLLALLSMIFIGAKIRIDTALDHPSFHRDRPEAMLKSDPALLYYITQRIVESNGLPYDGFGHDTCIEYPDGVDVAAIETPGQEFFIAWLYLLFGDGVPLHVFCVVAMAIFATLSVVGVYGLALELTGKVRWAVTAAALFTVMLANYRTIGFILIREDFALPWFSLHLWLLARAARRRTRAAMGLCGLAFLLAVSFWHAMGFVVAIEAACLLAWYLRTGQNPMRVTHAWVALAVVALGSLVVPVLRAKIFVLSLPMQILLALCAGAVLERRKRVARAVHTGAVAGALFLLALLALLCARVAEGGLGDYSHVFALMWTKIERLGRLPLDPQSIPFEARLLWQGPFETGTISTFMSQLPAGAILLPVALVYGMIGWSRGRGDPRFLLLAALAGAAAIVGYLVVRTIILSGVVAPVLVAVMLQRLLDGRSLLDETSSARPASRSSWAIWSGGIVLAHAAFMGSVLERYPMPWYIPVQQQEMPPLFQWIRNHVPDGEPIAADYLNSTAILCHTRHPILEQPKYETRESRRRIEEFFKVYFHGSAEELRKLLLERYRTRYLVVDPNVLWLGNRYIGGIPDSQTVPRPGTAAARLQAGDDLALRSILGYELLYRSQVPSSYRLFRLSE